MHIRGQCRTDPRLAGACATRRECNHEILDRFNIELLTLVQSADRGTIDLFLGALVARFERSVSELMTSAPRRSCR